MSLAIEIARGIWESIRETLPDSDETAGAWLSGFCWAFLIFIALLVIVSWLAVKTMGR
jgi:hypothetical protein